MGKWWFLVGFSVNLAAVVNVYHNYGTLPFLFWKLTISTGPFSIAMFVYQRVRGNGMKDTVKRFSPFGT